MNATLCDVPTWAQKSGERGIRVDRVFLENFINEQDLHPLDVAVLDKSQLHAQKLMLSQARRLLQESALDNRVHFEWKVGASQRLYTQNYNVQGVNRNLRPSFLPDNGYKFVKVEFPALQLRVMAELSGDPWLTEAFAQEKDIHAYFYGKLMGIPCSKVTQTQREKGKAMVHGFYFGFNPQGLAKRMSITLTDAKKLHRTLVEACPKYYSWAQEQVEAARSVGKVEAPEYDYSRKVDDLLSADDEERATAERSVINTLVQLHEAKLMAHWTEKLTNLCDCTPIMVVHDQILAQQRAELTCDELLESLPWHEGDVDFPAEVEVLDNWR